MDTTEQPAVTAEQIRAIILKLQALAGEPRRRVEGELWSLGPAGIAKFKEIIFSDYAKARQQGKLLWFAYGGTLFAVIFMGLTGGFDDSGPFLKQNWWLLASCVAGGVGVWARIPKRPLLATFEDKRAVPVLADLAAADNRQIQSASRVSLARLVPQLTAEEVDALTSEQRANIDRALNQEGKALRS